MKGCNLSKAMCKYWRKTPLTNSWSNSLKDHIVCYYQQLLATVQHVKMESGDSFKPSAQPLSVQILNPAWSTAEAPCPAVLMQYQWYMRAKQGQPEWRGQKTTRQNTSITAGLSDWLAPTALSTDIKIILTAVWCDKEWHGRWDFLVAIQICLVNHNVKVKGQTSS